MRLSEDSLLRALRIIGETYGPGARVWLFGSRVDDQKTGGDVDLYVDTASRGGMEDFRCQERLEELFGVDVDLVVGVGGQLIAQIAVGTGVLLSPETGGPAPGGTGTMTKERARELVLASRLITLAKHRETIDGYFAEAKFPDEPRNTLLL